MAIYVPKNRKVSATHLLGTAGIDGNQMTMHTGRYIYTVYIHYYTV